MSAPTVSVIIPTYNRADFLAEAMDSVLAQDYDDYEIVVVDDGSTDSTGTVLSERYGNRVRYHRQENAGVSAARNKGVSLSAGRYVAFLDSDDMWEAEKLGRMVSFMDEGGFAFAGHLTYLLEDGAKKENTRSCATPLSDGTLAEPRRAIVEGKFFQTLSFMCTRELFDRVGGFREDFSAAEDTLFAWQASETGKVGLLEEYLSVYRVHGGQTDFESSKILKDRIEARKIMLATLAEGEGRLARPLRDFASLSLFQCACALRSEGRFFAGARAAAAAVGIRPTVKNAARFALWWLGRDFRQRPVWQTAEVAAGTVTTVLGKRYISPPAAHTPETVVSVVIPTYNRADFIGETLDSCFAQTFDQYEIIVVDDGSTDGTEDLIKRRYGGKVRYLRQENMGVSAARNRGAEIARGKYLAFLDSDDLWLPGKLARTIDFMERGNFDLAGHLTYLLREGRIVKNPRACATPLEDGTLERPRLAIVERRFFQTLTMVSTMELFGRTGGFAEEFLNAQDTLWAWHAAGMGRVGLLEEYLSVYRVHAGQTADYTTSRSLRYRVASRRIMLESLGEKERDLEAPLREFTSSSLFQCASALRSEGHFREGVHKAVDAVRIQPTLKNAVRLALWGLGRDFRKPPRWRARQSAAT